MSIKRIGLDVFWDHDKQTFRKKRLNLEKIPLKFRCPNCGKILIGINDRDARPFVSYTYEESEKGELIKYGHSRLIRIETPNTFPDIFISLKLWGGVCYNCYLDGFGINGERGAYIKERLN
jgi:predicted RNA-binding Zn-ribbon protein involved in translation (DUF1610 family)